MTLTIDFRELPASPIHPTHRIWSYQDQPTEIRGFWYAVPNEMGGFLSSQPNLKSCCVGNHKLLHQQIRVYDDLSHLKNDHVVSLNGIFKIDPRYNSEGQLIQLYILNDVKEVYKESNIGWMLVAMFLLIGCVLFFKKFNH
ncbi:MAG: hypothetical protein Q8K60_06910 [Parachlamydiaceae bacterium]|nr:hypothetical protein [Parachlamydiaceae bacterium]